MFRVLGHKSSTNPSGNTCATVHSLVSFLSCSGLRVSEPCQLIPSFTEGMSKERLGRLLSFVAAWERVRWDGGTSRLEWA